MSLMEQLAFFAATDVGRKRSHNEDNFLVDRDLGLFAVADGMGGHAAGEIASAIAVRTVHEVVSAERDMLRQRAQSARGEVSSRQILGLLDYAVQRASQRIHAEAQTDRRKRGMGTTLSAVLVVEPHAFVAHVGDSRIYLVRNETVHQVTEDHTVANELLRLGMISRDQLDKVPRKNAITRAVGVYQHAEVDTLTLELLPNDQLVLSSDGLAGYLDETNTDIRRFLAEPDGERSVKAMIDFANEQGGKDNVTVLLVRFGGGDVHDSLRARRLEMKRDMLASLPLFSKLSERELLRVMQVADVYQYEKNEIVVREGEPGDRMFVILQGRVKVSQGRATLNELGPGDQLGEMGLIRSSPRSATVTATEPSELIALRREDFFEIIRTEPHVAVKLLWQFLSVLADRLEQTSRDLSIARDQGQLRTVDDPFAHPVVNEIASARLGIRPVAVELEDGTIERPRDAPSFSDAPPLAERRATAAGPQFGSPDIPTEPESVDAERAPPSFDTLGGDDSEIRETPVLRDAPTRPFDPAEAAAFESARKKTQPMKRFDDAELQSELKSVSSRPVPSRPRHETLRSAEAVGGRRSNVPAPVTVDGDARAGEPAPVPKPYVPRPEDATAPPEPPPPTPEVPTPPRHFRATVPDRPFRLGRSEKPTSPGMPVPREAQRTVKAGKKSDTDPVPATEDEAFERAKTVAIGGKPPPDFRPTKVTLPLQPHEALKSELEALREEFRERLKRSRRERDNKEGKDGD
jgi:serine/threonine protein phosphatase PrpC/CRP-like cAMP-binding protein